MTTSSVPPPFLASTSPIPFWLDSPARPIPLAALTEHKAAGLVVVGGGYQGLWTALKAKEREPDRDVVLLEADRVGGAASGRNGGFVSASLTHGIGNGHARWPDETATVERLGLANLAGLEADVRAYDIDCEFERTGKLTVATAPHQVDELRETQQLLNAHGHKVQLQDARQVAKRIVSPTFVGGTYEADAALVNPARLAWGLRDACLRLGVQIYEKTPATRLERDGGSVRVSTASGSVRAERIVLATNAFPPLLRRLRLHTVPVYDYALVTEPLDRGQRAAIGWYGREGVTDAGNQFHYFRLTADDRILWGGYDAVYHYGSRLTPSLDQRHKTFGTLAAQFVATFPPLAGIRFTHAWGGAIDTCTRFFAFYGTALNGRVAFALGHTGLGVAASRFAAETTLDLVEGKQTERTGLALVRRKPVPFPPEPLRWAAIQVTRWSLARADCNAGRRNVWLRLLDRFGVGYDS
jgi:glycine/D-amino acid oxidase-like deaminating enzyme